MAYKILYSVLLLTIVTNKGSVSTEDKIKPFSNNFLSLTNRRGNQREPEVQVSCSDTNPCEPRSFRVCSYGRCECPHPTEQWYWSSRGICEVDAGRPCEPDSVPCIKNAQCVADENSRTGYSCVCQNGLESDGFYCTNGFGRNCTDSWSWDEDGCNYSAGLGCRNNVCRCETEGDQLYDQIKKRCVQRRGFPCMTVNFGYWDCVTGTTCKTKVGSTEHPLLGVCESN